MERKKRWEKKAPFVLKGFKMNQTATLSTFFLRNLAPPGKKEKNPNKRERKENYKGKERAEKKKTIDKRKGRNRPAQTSHCPTDGEKTPLVNGIPNLQRPALVPLLRPSYTLDSFTSRRHPHHLTSY